MTRLFNDPTQFVDDMIEGFVAANGRWVRRVPGGVVRRVRPNKATVAVVIGGGSGHYPAFGGLVGAGLAHGAVMGNVFASPSADQVHSVAMSCQSGAGVLLTYGNYAGDVLNFDQAQRRLIAEGIPCRTVVVTDDISSAVPTKAAARRGIAGDLAVFKIAGAAAEQGHSLQEVAHLAAHANDMCRSLGVAFGGCTLPGADHPLFDVPRGRMAVGLGIHGEPGISEQEMPSADQLAKLFVSTLLAEQPQSVPALLDARLVVLLNGLGGVKYEELFVVYRRVAQLLSDAGVTVVEPEVGELVTSFDMAGASLTFLWLDDELEALWKAPADTPAFSKILAPAAPGEQPADDQIAPSLASIPPATDASRSASASVVEALRSARLSIDEHAGELGRLDAVAGDGDHGLGMQRGVRAAAEAAEAARLQGAGVRTTLMRAAEAWANGAGGASGALWGVAITAVASELSDEAVPSSTNLSAGVRAAVQAVKQAGRAQVGDKTMLDALEPFAVAAGSAADAPTATLDAWSQAVQAASIAADRTASMVARVGRARTHAERSLGTPDPGAVSFALVVGAVVQALLMHPPATRVSREIPDA
jgi:D-erythrulose 4-kinase